MERMLRPIKRRILETNVRLCRVSIVKLNIKSRELANFFFSTVDKMRV